MILRPGDGVAGQKAARQLLVHGVAERSDQPLGSWAEVAPVMPLGNWVGVAPGMLQGS